jgi:hypothetical protein
VALFVWQAGICRRPEFAADQVQRARLIKQLVRKGVTFGHLARTNLALDPGEAFVVYDGRELRACPDAAAAIAAVVRKVDLTPGLVAAPVELGRGFLLLPARSFFSPLSTPVEETKADEGRRSVDPP